MSSSLLTLSMLPRTWGAKTFAGPLPLSWAQYRDESLQTSSKNSETEVQRMRRMQKLFHSWRDDQIARAHQCCNNRSVSPPPVTSPMSFAVITQKVITATNPTLEGCPRRMPTLSLCDLRALHDTPWGPSMEFHQLAHRGRSWSTGTLSTPQDISVGTMSTWPKKMMKMPRKYHKYAKLPKGWVMAEVEDNKVEEVWAKQKKALSDSTIPGRLTWLASRLLPNPCLLSLMDSK